MLLSVLIKPGSVTGDEDRILVLLQNSKEITLTLGFLERKEQKVQISYPDSLKGESNRSAVKPRSHSTS